MDSMTPLSSGPGERMNSALSIPHKFDEENHLYLVDNHYVLATSDVISMCGMVDYDAVPLATLEKARWKGEQVHKAIHAFEEEDLDFDSIDPLVQPFFDSYIEFKALTGFRCIHPCERSLVYEHEGTGQFIGCHLDLVGWVDKKLYILDPKSTYPNSGAAKKTTYLRWRMQLQSYHEALATDESFWTSLTADQTPEVGRAIVHLQRDGSFLMDKHFIDFSDVDDSLNWDACVRVAWMRLTNGGKKPSKAN